MKIAIGFLLAFAVGALCRWFDIPLPAPPRLLGALLIVTATVGYLVVDRYLAARGAPPALESTRTAGDQPGDPSPPGESGRLPGM
jgi:XapX domain-containing protein